MRTWHWSLILAPLALACGGSDGGDEGEAEAEAEAEGEVQDRTRPPLDPADGEILKMRMSRLILPADSTSTDASSCDVDGNGDRENALGGILSIVVMMQQGNEGGIQESVDEQVSSGDVVLLWGLQGSFPDDPDAGLQAWLGDDPDSDGDGDPSTGALAIDPEGPQDIAMTGTLTAGQGDFGPGRLEVELPLGDAGPPITLELAGVKVTGTFADDGTITGGILCGGLPKNVFDQNVIPALHTFLQDLCAPDCELCGEECPADPAMCPVNDDCSTLLSLFDTSGDGTISEDEVRNNSLVMTFLRPDVDLFIGDPADNVRGQDCQYAAGARTPSDPTCLDSISLGVAHEAVGADFTLPTE